MKFTYMATFGFHPQLRYNYDDIISGAGKLDNLQDRMSLRNKIINLEYDKPPELQNTEMIRGLLKRNSKTGHVRSKASDVYMAAARNQSNPLISQDGLAREVLPDAEGGKVFNIGWSDYQPRGTTNPMSQLTGDT